jgi:DNA-binding XRE family transcriptional regulator
LAIRTSGDGWGVRLAISNEDNRLWYKRRRRAIFGCVSDPLQIFGANLKRARKRRGLSQEALGAAADVHRTHISKIERNLCEPGARTVAKLIVALGVEGGPLFEGTCLPDSAGV